MKIILSLMLAISLCGATHRVVQAQVTLQCGNNNDSCGFPSPPVQAFYTTIEQLENFFPDSSAIDRSIKVALHIVANSSNQLSVTPTQAKTSIDTLNRFLRNSKIKFRVVQVDTIVDNDYYNINPILRFDLFQVNRVPKALNIYYVNSID